MWVRWITWEVIILFIILWILLIIPFLLPNIIKFVYEEPLFLLPISIGVMNYINPMIENKINNWCSLRKTVKTLVCIVVIILLIVIYSSYSYLFTLNENKKQEAFINNVTQIIANPDKNVNLLQNKIDQIQNNSENNSNEDLSRLLSDTLNKMLKLKEKYDNDLNAIGTIQLNTMDYKNIEKINEVKTNLNSIDKVSDDYLFNLINTNKKDKVDFNDIYNHKWSLTVTSIQKQFKLQKDYIITWIGLYDYLLQIQDSIEIVNWELWINDDTIRNKVNDLINDMNSKFELYKNSL